MPDGDTIRIALLQHACDVDPAVNLDKAEAMAREAADQGAELIVTQELFTSQYFPQQQDPARFELAEPIPGPTSQRFGELAAELKIPISASLFEQRATGVYHNTTVTIDAFGQIVDKYRKMHIPDDPCFYEKFYFTPGDLGFRTQQVGKVTTGTLVCWDQWFPEAARLTAMQGAQLLLYPTAIATMPDESAEERRRARDAWQTMQRAHAIANGVFVAACNRVGVEDDLNFWGSSFVVDPGGTVIAQADETSEQVLVADCDLSLIGTYRKIWPFLRDRRIDEYDGLTKRFLD